MFLKFHDAYFFIYITLAAQIGTKPIDGNRLLFFGYENDESTIKTNEYSKNELHYSDNMSRIENCILANYEEIFKMDKIEYNLTENHYATINFQFDFIKEHVDFLINIIGTDIKYKYNEKLTFRYRNLNEISKKKHHIVSTIPIIEYNYLKVLVAVMTQHILQMIAFHYKNKISEQSDGNCKLKFYFLEILNYVFEDDYTFFYINFVARFFKKHDIYYKNNVNDFFDIKKLKNYKYDKLFLKFVYKMFDLSYYRFLKYAERKKIENLLLFPAKNFDDNHTKTFNLLNTPQTQFKIEDCENLLSKAYEKIRLNNILSVLYNHISDHISENIQYTMIIDVNFYYQFFTKFNNGLLTLQERIETEMRQSFKSLISFLINLIFKDADYYRMIDLITYLSKKENQKLIDNYDIYVGFNKINAFIMIDKFVDIKKFSIVF
ncbi:hypothetical protein GVAV_000768 [Gurleya vavrai]